MRTEYSTNADFADDTFPYEGVLAVLAIAVVAFAAVYVSPTVALLTLVGILIAFGANVLLAHFTESLEDGNRRS